MKQKIEIDIIELELLNLRLAESEAERERVQQELQALKSPLPNASSASRWRRATVATFSVLAVSTLLTYSVFHDAQSNAKDNNLLDASAISTLDSGHIERGEHSLANDRQPPTSNKAKTASQRQWGPSLAMTAPAASKSHSVFDTVVKAQQKNLLTLGFDLGEADGFKGARTRQALAEFRALYLPDSARHLQDAELAVIIETYADLARSDAARFGIDHGIVAAIRLSSVRTGVNFSYLMKLAATESNFEPASTSASSSATGMYQFTHDTWLSALKLHGANYGLIGDYAKKIEYYTTAYGHQRPKVRDKKLYQHLLDLRKNPRVSAMMAAETVRDSQHKLAHSLGRKPTQADLYLSHFLGEDAAITFLQSLEQNPDTHAVELFPEAASSNHDIFHPQTCEPRTVNEVYALFGEKFVTRRYDDLDAN